jgi:alkylation response protein AidB-like acyl-CoA dehydrogenase
VWAKNEQNEILGFLLEGVSEGPGVKVQPESNKYGMRILQSSKVAFKNFEVSSSQRLEKALSVGESRTLLKQRVWICWMVAGICIAVYDSTVRYASQRSQFDRPIAGTSL